MLPSAAHFFRHLAQGKVGKLRLSVVESWHTEQLLIYLCLEVTRDRWTSDLLQMINTVCLYKKSSDNWGQCNFALILKPKPDNIIYGSEIVSNNLYHLCTCIWQCSVLPAEQFHRSNSHHDTWTTKRKKHNLSDFCWPNEEVKHLILSVSSW